MQDSIALPPHLVERYADLGPGDLLYVPQYWFHQMEGLTDNISLSWWFKHLTKKGIDLSKIDMKDISLIAVRRNLGIAYVCMYICMYVNMYCCMCRFV